MQNNEITFELTPRLVKWIDRHDQKCYSHATAGEHYSFTFLPSGIVECQTVKCLCCGKEVTDYV